MTKNNSTIEFPTLEEKLIEAAKEYETHKGFNEIVCNPLAKAITSAYGIGFLEGGVWMKNEAIDKAAEWIKDMVCYYSTVSTDENYDNYVDFDLDKMVEDFKKAMNE